MLTVKCAEALGCSVSRAKYQPHGQVWVTPPHGEQSMPSSFLYSPSSDPSQAFELLCWLASKGTVTVSFDWNNFRFSQLHDSEEQPCRTPAELRLALMRATVKVHEGRGK